MSIDGSVRAAPELLKRFHQDEGIQNILAEIRLYIVWDVVRLLMREFRFPNLIRSYS
jgi:hypothetical protein